MGKNAILSSKLRVFPPIGVLLLMRGWDDSIVFAVLTSCKGVAGRGVSDPDSCTGGSVVKGSRFLYLGVSL